MSNFKKNKFISKIILLISCFIFNPISQAGEAQQYLGTNLGGAALGGSVLPGTQGINYVWATEADVSNYAALGFNTLRIPFLWERMQPILNKPLDQTEVNYLDIVINAAAKKKITVIIDLHNYGQYHKNLIGSESVPIGAFNDFWQRIAKRYKNNPNVIFGLMNEPNKQKADEWAKIAQSAIFSIRDTGAKQTILVPSTVWSSGVKWLSKDGTLSNAEALSGIKDPANNFVFEIHQYFDSDTSGTHSNCVNEDIGVNRLSDVTKWMKENNRKAFLGEFGASTDPVCLAAMKNTLSFIKTNADVWAGWTYWVAAPWMNNYMFNIYPPEPSLPQMKVMQSFLMNQ